jgi:hypothetical protein
MSKAKIKAMADEVRKVTMDEASKMPGMLGKIVPCHFKEMGYYSRLENGKKVYYELA